LLRSDTQLAIELIESILTENFPESIIPEITAQLGLEFTFRQVSKRDPNFRREVLRAYNYQCAICGFDLRMDDVSVGLEAAHIKWKQFHGPCTVNNGLALCAIHHKAFDKGVIGISPDFRIMLSPALNGGNMVEKLFHCYLDKKINEVNNVNNHPSIDMLDWHFTEVYKK